ncbi:MFS transporter [Klebsiella pneumoniae]|uniref:MFS transporter n=1 Tax=Klebsiella pneumoniae TaxID=573 RepID=A0A927E5A8_KLEPN|nr:MFS transporter [Klebsiella pneumoniae]
MVSASGQLFFGPLSDRIGRLKPLALSLLLFIFSSAMCALTRDINMLIVWRFYKALPAPAARCCRDPSPAINTEGTLLTQFFALLMTVNGIAPVLSPVLGGYVITAFDWRILFWTMAAIGGVLLVMSTGDPAGNAPGHSGACQPPTARPAGAEKSPLSALLPDPGAFMMAGLFSYIGSSSFVMQSEYGMSAMQFSLLFGLNGIGLIIAAMIFSRLARRFSAESLLRGGLTLAVSCAAIMLLFAPAASAGAGAGRPVLYRVADERHQHRRRRGGDERGRRRAVRDRVRADGHPDVCLRRHRRAAGGSRRRNNAENEPRDGHLLPAGAAAGPQQTARRTLISCCGNKIFQIYYRTISRHTYHSPIILHVLIVILFTGKE